MKTTLLSLFLFIMGATTLHLFIWFVCWTCDVTPDIVVVIFEIAFGLCISASYLKKEKLIDL